MSIRTIVFAGVLGLAVAALATANLNCSVLSALADGGVIPGTDGGGVAGVDGGGEPADGGGVTTGSVKVSVTCSGDGCKSGNLIVEVKACGGAVIKADTSKTDVTMTSSTPIEVTLTDIPAGSACVTAFLDVDKNGSKNAGDAVPSAGEVSISVTAGTETAASVDLNQLQS
jgi:hypothetical protein